MEANVYSEFTPVGHGTIGKEPMWTKPYSATPKTLKSIVDKTLHIRPLYHGYVQNLKVASGEHFHGWVKYPLESGDMVQFKEDPYNEGAVAVLLKDAHDKCFSRSAR